MSQNNLLKNIYLFKQMTNDELELINEISEINTYTPGDDIFSQDDVATSLYVISFGSVKIHIKGTEGDNIEVANLGTGSHFGEMALIDGEKRSASATALEKTDIVSINYDKLKLLLKEYPTIAVKLYEALSKFLCGRLRITTNDLSFAREKNISHF
ncbi:MAG: cyclic nucleotide-binding domain-containing protein [Bdellovibrionaceae bacterium]|nr:cyclic nucleotide-binding domain-containing protein [Pseudobdellovibrionaceae bacterium]